MSLHHDMKALSRAVRPKIMKMARRQKLVDQCFKEFQRAVYPGAPQDQVREMRTCFFAGAAELVAMITYGADTATDDATDEDLMFMQNIHEEIERFHRRTIDTATTPRGRPT
jgi:hypothetical protein